MRALSSLSGLVSWNQPTRAASCSAARTVRCDCGGRLEGGARPLTSRSRSSGRWVTTVRAAAAAARVGRGKRGSSGPVPVLLAQGLCLCCSRVIVRSQGPISTGFGPSNLPQTGETAGNIQVELMNLRLSQIASLLGTGKRKAEAGRREAITEDQGRRQRLAVRPISRPDIRASVCVCVCV